MIWCFISWTRRLTNGNYPLTNINISTTKHPAFTTFNVRTKIFPLDESKILASTASKNLIAYSKVNLSMNLLNR